MGRKLNLVAVGDVSSQKTELLHKYTCANKHFREFLIPRDNIEDIVVDGVRYCVHFVDAQSDDDYVILRKNAIMKADCVLLCYSIGNKDSFENLSKWCIEVRKYSPLVPIILVGTGAEWRTNEKVECVSSEQAENFKHLIGASAYLECSLENFTGVDDIFIEAVRSTRRHP